MIYSELEAVELVKKNLSTPKWVIDAREHQEKAEALVLGDDFTELLVNKIEHIESAKKVKIRKDYSRNIIDLFERVGRPIDNVFSSTGGGVDFLTKKDTTIKHLALALSDVRGGMSLRRYSEKVIKEQLIIEPNGVQYIEYTSDKFWINPVSIESIRNYESNNGGQLLEWILFEPEKAKMLNNDVEIFRLVDAMKIHFILKRGDSLSYIAEKSHTHPFGRVPAVINSDIHDLKDKIRQSIYGKIFPLAMEYARDVTIKILFKITKGFPLFWRLAMQCPSCHGTGKNGNTKCPDCDGTGLAKRRDITDEIVVGIPEPNDPIVTPNIAGYITPPSEILDMFNNEDKLSENKIMDTIWGSHIEKSNNETATGRFIDVNPKIQRLNAIADSLEYIEESLANLIANLVDLTKDRKEKAIEIKYGRNYILESTNELINQYETAKEKQLSVSILENMLKEIVLSKYKRNTNQLNTILKKIEIEPYVHFTLDQTEKLFGIKEAQKKILFAEFWKKANTNNTVEELEREFELYINEKQQQQDGSSL